MNIQEIINQQLAADQEKLKTRERSGKYSPSMLGRCYRAQFWNRLNEPITNPPDERSLRVLKAGGIFHWWVQRIVLENNPQIHKEVLVEDDDFKGFADLVNTDEVVDIKTMHSKGFWYLEKAKDIKKEKYEAWLQVMFYTLKLGKIYGKLCFVSKDDLTMSEYRQPIEGYWLNELGKETATLREIWVRKQLPPCQPRAYNGKECKYCNWRDKCQKGEQSADSK